MGSYSGKFVLRLTPKTHQRLSELAKKKYLSLNQLCSQFIERGLLAKKESPPQNWSKLISLLLPRLQQRFGIHLLGVVLFGSRISGTSTTNSDLDILIVLDHRTPTCRALYQWWDEQFSNLNFDFELSPHFVNLPNSSGEAGSLWFEVALSSHLLYQHKDIMTKWLQEVQQFITEGNVRREWIHGHPYWARRSA